MIREKWLVPEHYKEVSIAILQENLAALRAKIGISQEELANVMGVTRQTYFAIESGKRDMLWVSFMALMFFFSSIDSTAEMIRELRIYPIELVMRFNGAISNEEMGRLMARDR